MAGRPCALAAGQGGFSLVAAIFLIVVLAALGAVAVQVAMAQYQSVNVELLEARAQAAADAGIGYVATRALTASDCPGSRRLSLTGSALAGFAVTVTCRHARQQIYSGTPPTAQTYDVYALGATASFGAYGKPDYVARSAARTVTSPPP